MAKRSLLIIVIIIAVSITVYMVNQQSHLLVTPSLEMSISNARAKRFNLIIDVRTLKEREELGYYPNSIPIAANNLQHEVPVLTSSKNNSILVYSNGGDRLAENAANILYKMGYHNVRYIASSYLQMMPGV